MSYLKTIFTLCLFFAGQNLFAQITASGDLVQKIGQIIDNIPGDSGDDYAPPTNLQLANWESCLLHLLQKNYTECEAIANQLDYDLIRFTDNENSQIYYILQSQNLGSNYWGTYVFNPAACQANLILQAPHPINDSNTGDQGIYILREIGALFFMVAGTHRCNSDNYSTCSGTTSTCDNGSESFRISDMAHIDNSIFHHTTASLLDKVIDPFFIQLHGFSKGTDDPALILSNSTTLAPPVDYLSTLGNAIVAIDTSLTFEVAHLNPAIRLKGTTNTQGRLINESTNPCTIAAPMNTGHFLHIEQERPRLRADVIGWQKLATALKMTFRNLNLGTNILTIKDYGAIDTLSAATLIANGTNSNFKAGKVIALQKGFHAESGSTFLAKIDACLASVPLQQKIRFKTQARSTSTSLKIAPNPFVHSVTIDLDLPKSQQISISLYNATGILLKEIVLNEQLIKGNHQYILTKNNFPTSGIYFLKIESAIASFTQKLIRLD